MHIFDFIVLSGAEQAKMLVVALFSIVLFVIIPYFRRNISDKENSSKSGGNENNNVSSFNSSIKIRTDGYYISKYEALNDLNEKESLYFFIFFTNNGYAGFSEIDDFDEWKKYNSDEDLKEIILEANKNIDENNHQIIAKYELASGQIRMKFYDPDDFSNDDINNLLTYQELYGRVINNGLILSLDLAYFNNALQDYVKENQIENLKFKFHKIM